MKRSLADPPVLTFRAVVALAQARAHPRPGQQPLRPPGSRIRVWITTAARSSRRRSGSVAARRAGRGSPAGLTVARRRPVAAHLQAQGLPLDPDLAPERGLSLDPDPVPAAMPGDLEKVCAKLGVRTRVEAVASAARAGLIEAE